MANSKRVATSEPKTIDEGIHLLVQRYGPGAIMRMGDAPKLHVETISTGSLSLDEALGVGGLPRGRIVEIYGPEGGGKSTLAMHVVAEAQRAGGVCAYVDAEHAMDPVYAKAIGVDIDELLISQPDDGEQALETAEMMCGLRGVDVVIVDSVAALTPRAEIEGQMGDTHVGLQARLMSQALRKLAAKVSKSHVILIFINQLREKVGVVYGSPEVTPGGRALKFYASVRLDVRRVEAIKDGDEVVGHKTRVKVVKNKVSPPFRIAEFNMMYGRGIDRSVDLLETAVRHNIIEKSGIQYRYQGQKLANGKSDTAAYLEAEGAHVANQVRQKLRDLLFSDNAAGEPASQASSPDPGQKPTGDTNSSEGDNPGVADIPANAQTPAETAETPPAERKPTMKDEILAELAKKPSTAADIAAAIGRPRPSVGRDLAELARESRVRCDDSTPKVYALA
jgi:recombination protein RecA